MGKRKDAKHFWKKKTQFLAAALLTAALMAGQAAPAFAEGGSVMEAGSLLPDNVTIEEPTALSNISLPSSDYGTLSWADGTYVPSRRTEACEVIFKPYAFVDPAQFSDLEEGVYRGTITVVVSSIQDSEETSGEAEEESSGEVPPEDAEQAGGGEEQISGGEAEKGDDEDGQEENGGEGSGEKSPDVTDTPAPEESVPPVPGEGAAPEPEENVSPAPGETAASKPEVSSVPEESAVPTPEESGVPVPEISEAPAPEVTAAPEAEAVPEVTAAPEPAETPGLEKTPEDSYNIFNLAAPADNRPSVAEDGLTEEEELLRAIENHSCNGIYVSGIDLPWYVQFQVSESDGYEFSNKKEAVIFRSYDFKLWDLKHDREYKIPDGKYISLTVPVRPGYEYTVEHHLDNGAVESIIPSVDGGTMIFSTHSFSSFGIAGSKPLVGNDLASSSYGTPTPAPTAAPTRRPAVTSKPSVTAGAENGESESPSAQSSQSGTERSAVETGDHTVIYPFVFLLIAAAVVIGAVLAVRKRK